MKDLKSTKRDFVTNKLKQYLRDYKRSLQLNRGLMKNEEI